MNVDIGTKSCDERTIHPLSLAVSLGVIGCGKLQGTLKLLEERTPKGRIELWILITNNCFWQSMGAENILEEKVSQLRSRDSLHSWKDSSHFGKTVNHHTNG